MTADAASGASGADPLAGLERPRGDADALLALAARYEAGSASLTGAAQQLARTVGQVLGQAWTGQAAAACGASCVRSAQAVLVAGQAYGTAASTLRVHGARLAAAQGTYDAARRLADEALLEEHVHRQAAAAAALQPGGPASFGDLVWQSPLRALARARAEQAVADATASAGQAASVLDGLTAPLRAAAPATAAARAQPKGHWYDQITGFTSGLWDGIASPVAMVGGLVGLNGDAGDSWSALGSGLRHAFTHPKDFAEAVIGGDDLSHGRFGHWAGEFAPTVVATFFSGGAAAGVKGADAIMAADRAAQVLADASAATKATDVTELLSGGRISRIRNDLHFEGEWAAQAYDEIRSADDVADVARSVAVHGFNLEDVRRIKAHLFEDEHLLDRYGSSEIARFDADPRIAEAWMRLREGAAHPQDIALMKHELYELKHMSESATGSYNDAHEAANAAGLTWDPEAAANDGFGWPSRKD